MSRVSIAATVLVLLVGVAVGVLLGSHATPAVAQGAPAADVKAITAPSPVVSAVPYQSRTEYEQDPFETTRLRRTATTVQSIMLVHADGSVEVKQAP